LSVLSVLGRSLTSLGQRNAFVLRCWTLERVGGELDDGVSMPRRMHAMWQPQYETGLRCQMAAVDVDGDWGARTAVFQILAVCYPAEL
jgi:hypothetical protein